MFIENISVFQKSSTNQGEIDMLWEQCDTQKKMIRTLHDEMDNTRNDFNKKLEKYKVSQSNGQQVHQYQQTVTVVVVSSNPAYGEVYSIQYNDIW
jgi:uncharacterized membrane protein YgaE (UPF0421/DUF939 family)